MPVRPTVTYNGQAITAESFEVNIRRGRSRELDEFQAVSGSILVHNYDANFAPPWFTTPAFLLMESGDYLLLENGDRIQLEQGSEASGAYGVIELGGTLVVNDGAVTVFSGHLEDVNVSYDSSGRATAELVCGDVLTSLASTNLAEEWRPTDGQYSGPRLVEILQRADVDLSVATGGIDQGHMRMQGAFVTTDADGNEVVTGYVVAPGTNALQEAQRIARTEDGKFFVTASGGLQFYGRYNFPSETPAASFSDTGSALPFSRLTVAFGSELRAWRASVQRVGGVAQVATAATAAPAALGERTITRVGLLHRGDAYSRSLAQHLASKYADVRAFVDSLVVPLARLSTSDRATVCGLDINDTISLTWTPTGGSQIIQTLVVEGVTYSARSTGDATLTLQLSAFPTTNYLTLDTDSYDSGVPFGY